MPVRDDEASPAPKLQLTRVNRNFAGIRAVRDVTLRLSPGERRTIIGPNGAGKTTLFNVVAGSMPVSSGRIELDGTDITGTPGRVRVGYGMTRTYQHSQLLDELSITQNIRVAIQGSRGGGYRLYRRRGEEKRLDEEAAGLAGRVGLAGRMDRLVSDLSHGEKRQLEIAMALAGGPSLLLLDEPAAGLGPGERGALTSLLTSLDRTMTVLLIEHDMDVALAVADRVTVMHEGSIVADAAPDDVLTDPLVLDLYLGRQGGPSATGAAMSSTSREHEEIK
jgi:branched-chain amino acid transport system ATP-binding protein